MTNEQGHRRGLTLFEGLGGVVAPVRWCHASVFSSNSPTRSATVYTSYYEPKEGARYVWALNLRNAKRKLLSP